MGAGGKNPPGRPRNDGRPAGSLPPPAKPAGAADAPGKTPPVEALPVEFVWETADAQDFGDAGFDLGYLQWGAGHDHWLSAKEDYRKSGAYAKWARILNKLALKNPLYLLAGLTAINYATAMVSCNARSKAIKQKAESIGDA